LLPQACSPDMSNWTRKSALFPSLMSFKTSSDTIPATIQGVPPPTMSYLSSPPTPRKRYSDCVIDGASPETILPNFFLRRNTSHLPAPFGSLGAGIHSGMGPEERLLLCPLSSLPTTPGKKLFAKSSPFPPTRLLLSHILGHPWIKQLPLC